jgi:hypothetical protein
MGDGSMFDQRLGGTVLVDEQIRLLTLVDIFGAVALAAEIAFGFGAQGVARDIVEKAYERRDEAKQTVQQQGGESGQSTSTGGSSTGGDTTFGDEDRPSARPLRREE